MANNNQMIIYLNSVKEEFHKIGVDWQHFFHYTKVLSVQCGYLKTKLKIDGSIEKYKARSNSLRFLANTQP